MAKNNSTRKGCKDVFRSFLVSEANFSGKLELPCIKPEFHNPNRLIPFSKAIGCRDTDQWVHFYEDDVCFERIWNTPQKYLPILAKFNGVISPDFSLYRDMPLVMQQWNTYRGRAIGHWLQENGIPVIPNVRFGDTRSYEFCCEGVPMHSTIAVGTHGCMKLLKERGFFKMGLAHVVKTLQPASIVVYGAAPDDVFGFCKEMDITVVAYESLFNETHKVVSA